MAESPLLHRYLDPIAAACLEAPALDLACGTGRKGLYLLRQGVPVVFADIRPAALQAVKEQIAVEKPDRQLADFWQVDLEQAGSTPLAGRQFGAILVFRYLHRPLLPAIREASIPGGLVIYETFTVDQPRFGRPTNPDFLLQRRELAATFHDWEILESWEGVSRRTATARIVARKPAG